MKYKIEELKDITDSREIMQSKPNSFSKYMTYIIIILLTSVIIWSILANKEITVKASGVVRPSVEIAKLSSAVNGTISEVNISEGMEVKKGDVLLVISGEEYELQKKSLEESLKNREKELEANKKLKSSILDGVNHLNSEDSVEGTYYKKYKLYLDNLKSGNTQVDSLESQKENIKATINDFKLLLKAIEEEKNQFDSNHYLYYQYKDYEMTIQNYRKQISSYKEQITELEKTRDKADKENQQIENNNEIIDKQIKEIQNNIRNTENEIEKYKNSQKMNISNTIAQNELKLNEGVATSSNGSYKEQYISQLDSTIMSLESSISEIEMNLNIANNKIEATSIKADSDGILNLINDLKVGDFVQAGTQIASIIPRDNDKYKAEVYIENRRFGEIKDGEDVILEFVSLPQREYGIVKSNLKDISVDAKVSEKEKTSFYTGICDIPVKSMTNKKGNSINIKNGMLVEARIINREVSYFRYFLEKINILD
jgi:membrane fusion protein, peptide pheromone/bacteriocin exporter